MLDILILRLSAPMIAFGGPIVDNLGVIREFPASSMLTGLLGNALGYEHHETTKLQLLQDRLHFAIRCDCQGTKIVDYQTVDLGQDHMRDTGWTTSNKKEDRRGGKAKNGTHERYRHYWTDSVYTISLTLETHADIPTMDMLEQALQTPSRPLFLGRKCCLPSENILYMRIQKTSLVEALSNIPLASQAMHQMPSIVRIWCSTDETLPGEHRSIPITDQRDWHNQIHCGRRMIKEGILKLQDVHYE